MARLRYNGLASELGASLDATGTAITFAAALTHSGGTAVPTITGSDYIALAILDAAGVLTEIVYLTAYTSGATTGTITRGQEGTTGTTHALADAVINGPTTLDFTASTSSGGTDRPLVDPTTYTWSWINQGVASVATQGKSLLLSSPAESADSWHFRAKTVPAKPYSVIVHQKITRMDINYSGASVGWLQSSNNNFALFSQRGSGLIMASAYSTAPFALTTNYLETNSPRLWEWVKLTDDATNRRIYVSADGYNWVLFHSVATNSNITPDRLVFGIEARNASYGIGLMVDSWEEGA